MGPLHEGLGEELAVGIGVLGRGHPTLPMDTSLRSSPILCHQGSGLHTFRYEVLDTVLLIAWVPGTAVLISRLFSCVFPCQSASLTTYLQKRTKRLHSCSLHCEVATAPALPQSPVTCHSLRCFLKILQS